MRNADGPRWRGFDGLWRDGDPPAGWWRSRDDRWYPPDAPRPDWTAPIPPTPPPPGPSGWQQPYPGDVTPTAASPGWQQAQYPGDDTVSAHWAPGAVGRARAVQRDGFWAGAWAGYTGWPRWAKVGAPIVVALFVLVAIGSTAPPEETETAGRVDIDETSVPEPTTTTTEAATTTLPPTTTTTTPPPQPTAPPTTAAPPPPAAPAPAPPPAPAPEPSGCHSSYSGCVPIASDVDCAGGSGNGPAYVNGPVNVLGADPYGLDHDNDGIGCE